MKIRPAIAIISFLAISAFIIFKLTALALVSSSTTFYLKQNIEQTAGSAISASFKERESGGQTASGISTSTSFGLRSGWMFALDVPFGPQYEQTHFHWRNDDGLEAAATSATGGTQDTTLANLAKSTTKRLRLEVANTGGTMLNFSTQQFRLEYALQGGGCATSTYTDVGAVGGDWDMAASQLTEGSDTTNISVASGGVSDSNSSFLTPNGGQRETASQTGALTLSSDKFVELEYAVQALPAATDGATYCFRVSNAGSSTNFLYSSYALAAISSGNTVSCTTNIASTAFGTLLTTQIATSSQNASSTMTCNGVLGCTLYVQDVGNGTSPGLATSSPAHLIPSASTTLVAGAEGYGIQATSTAAGSGGSLGFNPTYYVNGNVVGGLSTSTILLASSTSAVTNREVLITHKVAISGITPVATYADTITYSCIAN